MRKNKDSERNQLLVTLDVFLSDYNQNIPVGFPLATPVILKKFQDVHPTLFKDKNLWSIDRHRKRLIDWLASGPDLE